MRSDVQYAPTTFDRVITQLEIPVEMTTRPAFIPTSLCIYDTPQPLTTASIGNSISYEYAT
jgi:hypothetical protein